MDTDVVEMLSMLASRSLNSIISDSEMCIYNDDDEDND